ncbi:UDP-N-acetylglucosamine--LPS N-acetylglucosamine transferase [Palleronia sp.]|uniref:UDP-N-acetylglucosamine--LPS N-acetylglucosamine transferase n=1 Tax=Palleronia sp. TaxID=1940284 RepID=UPI0035C86D2A
MAAKKRLLAVASSGGHWEQLVLLSDAFEGGDVWYACPDRGQSDRYGGLPQFQEISDYNQTQPLLILAGLVETFRLLRRIRPDIVVSTGAAPGLLCLLWGRIMGARTIWIDSIANAERLSLSGRLALRFAHLTITQWQHLAAQSRARYYGSVL